MTQTCPVCGHPVSDQDTACLTCGFKLLGATQAFSPVSLEPQEAPAQPPAATEASLHVVRGPQVGMVYALGSEPVTIGRNPKCTIFLNDMTVSRMHATIEPEAGCFIIRDANSYNGVWVNNENVEARTLRPGDYVQIGTFGMKYEEN